MEIKPPQRWEILASAGTSENPGQNPAHDSFSALAFCEVQNCNNSDPETIECKGNEDTAQRKVFGGHLLFHSLSSLNKSHISNFCVVLVLETGMLCVKTSDIQLFCWPGCPVLITGVCHLFLPSQAGTAPVCKCLPIYINNPGPGTQWQTGHRWGHK